MEKASKAIRRSGVRLRTISSRHAELEMLISELRTVRAAHRSLVGAQGRAAHDLVKWALRDENRAVQTTAQLLVELTALYTDVQNEFNAQLKALRYQFEMILEGEEQLDTCRSQLAACETKEAKHRRDLKKAAAADRQQLEVKLAASERAKAAAQMEVTERTRENEAAKMTRLKQGLLALSTAYLELASRTQVVFEAHRDIASELPDLDAQQLHTAKYTGSERCQERLSRVREMLKPADPSSAAASPAKSPPPPYSGETPDRRLSVASSAGSTPCRCGANRSYGWRDSSAASAAGDYSPSAPLDGSGHYAAGPAAPYPTALSPGGYPGTYDPRRRPAPAVPPDPHSAPGGQLYPPGVPGVQGYPPGVPGVPVYPPGVQVYPQGPGGGAWGCPNAELSGAVSGIQLR